MPNEYLHPSDIKRAHVLTRIIEGRVEENVTYDVPFSPFFPTMQRKVKVAIREFDPSGLASFHADNASTPIVKGGGAIEERYMELVEISEKHVLSATDLIALNSPDVSVAEGAARDIVKLGVQLRRRNINRTRWMAWMAARDALTIGYPDGGSITIDFDLDGDTINTDFSGSHLPTYAGIGDGHAWNYEDTNGDYPADIIEALYTWTKLIADDLGVEQSECIAHVNSATLRYMRKNKGIKGELSSQSPRIITPRREEIVQILELADIRVVNDYYKLDTDAITKHRFIPDGYMLLTAPYVVNGIPIMEMYDGPVVRVVNGELVVERNPGAQTEIYADLEQKASNIRVSTARMPVMNYPAAFVWARVY
jgi:hypothetical protein